MVRLRKSSFLYLNFNNQYEIIIIKLIYLNHYFIKIINIILYFQI
ncbi:hypothetical protein CCP3SC1AL1_1280008 [Gammaproteobacteria bacterium]